MNHNKRPYKENMLHILTGRWLKSNCVLDNIYVYFGNKVYRYIVGTPMSTNYSSLIADYFCVLNYSKNPSLSS